MLAALALGAVLATGLALLLVTAIGPAPLDLAAAWRHVHLRDSVQPPPWTWRARLEALVERLVRAAERAHHPWLGLPHTDLALLEISPNAYIRRRLHTATIATAVGLVAGTVAGALASSPWPIPLTAVAGLAAGGLWPAWRLRETAATRRRDARRALAVYLELVAGERAAGNAPEPALAHAAALGEHWLFQRLHRSLSHAQRVGATPWSALRELGTRWELDTLTETAELASLAADGAAIRQTLTAQAAALRHRLRYEARADANAASERLTLPTSLLLLPFLIVVAYPVVAHLLAT